MKTRLINDRYKVVMPDHLADWDALSSWEKCRFASMEANLKEGDLLYDVGSEQGTLSAVYAQFVGGENMCLFEPASEFWPIIKAIWEANNLKTPHSTFEGFCSDAYTRSQPYINLEKWPASAEGPSIEEGRPYRYLHNDKDYLEIPSIRIDDFMRATDTDPAAITIDVEGAEVKVLKGARETIDRCRPLVWVSIHPDLMKRDYNSHPNDITDLMESLGYHQHHLGTDHEEHWLFYPQSGPLPVGI